VANAPVARHARLVLNAHGSDRPRSETVREGSATASNWDSKPEISRFLSMHVTFRNLSRITAPLMLVNTTATD
ncbi:MAG: hypothetical protein AAFY15_09005, partial [Cyanobacteria bacterium J06648_11]